MVRSAPVICFLLLASHFAGGQPSQSRRTPKTKERPEIQTKILQVDEATRLDIPPFAMFGVAQSDHDGNIYVLTNAMGDRRGAVGLKLNDRSETTAYKVRDEDGSVLLLGVSPSGTVGIMTDSRKPPYHSVVLFDRSGQPYSRLTLDVPVHIHPTSLLMFDDGNFLLRAYYTTENDKELQGKPYVVLLNTIGRPIKELSSLDQDAKLAEAGVKPFDGAAVVGDDERVYFALGDTVKVMSEGFEILGTYSIPKPSPDFTVSKIAKIGNRLAIWEIRPTKEGPIELRLAVIDVVTHEPIAFYSPEERLGTWCFSFTGTGFQFLIEEGGVLKLVAAHLK